MVDPFRALACGITVLALTASAPSFAQVATNAWMADRPANGWTRIDTAADGSSIGFIRRVPASSSRARVRVELRRATSSGALSYSGLVEYDCVRRRSRILETSLYSGPNLTGRETRLPSNVEPWETLDPNTAGDVELSWVCHR